MWEFKSTAWPYYRILRQRYIQGFHPAGIQNCICMPLKRYFKSRFSKMNCHSINTFSSSTKGMGGGWHYQLFYIKKSFFSTAYGMATPPLVWIYTFIFMAKYSHGGYYICEVEFWIIPEIIQFMHYTPWYPV